MTAPTVVLIDDHHLIVETLGAALVHSHVRCIAIPPGPRDELLHAVAAVSPDLVLLDLDLGRFGNSLPLIAPLTAAGARVLILSGHPDRLLLAQALEQGAIGLQPKSAGFDHLIDAVETALAGKPVHPDRSARLLAELTAHRARVNESLAPFHQLTDREQETLRQLADGHTVAEIARVWVVSQATVRSHVQSVLRKVGASSQLEAVAAARSSGWLDR